jgi:hypothetical protein
MAERARLFDGKKFLWDGVEYESEEEARRAGETYTEKGFDVEVWLAEGKAFVYTRRAVKETANEQTHAPGGEEDRR